jgi:hypothetical protein
MGPSVLQVGPSHLPEYVDGVSKLVTAVKLTFPQSKVLWRTMHPGYKHSITPSVVSMFNEAIRAKAPEWGLHLLDVGRMIEQLSPRVHAVSSPKDRSSPYGTIDGRHLHEWLNVALLNIILNILGQKPSRAV